MEVSIDRQQGANAWLTIGIREGRNREIRRALEHVGLSVNRLIRISYGPFQLGTLKRGAVEQVKPRCCASNWARRRMAAKSLDLPHESRAAKHPYPPKRRARQTWWWTPVNLSAFAGLSLSKCAANPYVERSRFYEVSRDHDDGRVAENAYALLVALMLYVAIVGG